MMELRDGVPGVDAPDPLNYEQFWPYYVSQHLHPATRVIHVAGTLAALGTGLFGIVTRRPKVFAVAPLLGYGPAWASHLAIEHNKPATLGNPLWSIRADFRQIGRMLTGRLGDDIAAVRQSLGMNPTERTLADRRVRTERSAPGRAA
jgi:hypothetical protein